MTDLNHERNLDQPVEPVLEPTLPEQDHIIEEEPTQRDEKVFGEDKVIEEKVLAEEPQQDKKKKKEKKKKTVGQEILSWVGTLLLAVVIAMVIRAFLFEPIRVDGRSMLETLQDGEIVLVTKPAVWTNSLKRGDVVIVRFPNRNKTTAIHIGAPLDLELVSHELFVKRLVALPGDSVAMMGGQLYVNDALVPEDYITYPARQDYARRVLGENEYMVMGDNRASSHDGRSSDVGPISRDMLVGKASLVLLPFNKIRTIH